MSTAFFPQGMKSYNNSLNRGGYETWKGIGLYKNPLAITAGNVRPLTNLAARGRISGAPINVNQESYGPYTPGASQIYKRGAKRPRPLKWQYRRQTLSVDVDDRGAKSTSGLANRTGGLIGQLMDMPGGYSVKPNTSSEFFDCTTCDGIGLITDYYPSQNLTNNPEPISTTAPFCCNEQKKALKRVRPASTNLKKNYYTTLQQYRQNRCQTYEQKAFNFESKDITQENTFYANCYPNINEIDSPSNPRGCKLVVYKPNNPRFKAQGAVSSSLRTYSLAVRNYSWADYQAKTAVANCCSNNNAIEYKTKSQPCRYTLPTILRQIPSFNNFACSTKMTKNKIISNGKPTPANNGISSSTPGGQPIKG